MQRPLFDLFCQFASLNPYPSVAFQLQLDYDVRRRVWIEWIGKNTLILSIHINISRLIPVRLRSEWMYTYITIFEMFSCWLKG